MEDYLRAFEQYYYQIILAGIAIGFVLGLIPFYLGRKRNKRGLGLVGLILSAAIGGLSPLLAIILAAIFSFLIARGSDPKPNPDVAGDEAGASAMTEEKSADGTEAAASASADDENA